MKILLTSLFIVVFIIWLSFNIYQLSSPSGKHTTHESLSPSNPRFRGDVKESDLVKKKFSHSTSDLTSTETDIRAHYKTLAIINFVTVFMLLICSLGILFWQRIIHSKKYRLNYDAYKEKREELERTHKALGGMLQDIKIEKQKVLSLTDENTQLIKLVHQSRDGILRLDRLGKIKNANLIAQEIFNFTYPDYKAANFFKLFSPTETKLIKSEFEKILDRSHSAPIQITKEIQGKPCSLEIIMSPITSDNGELSSIAVMLRDISKRIEEKRLLQTIIEHTPHALIMTKLNGEMLLINDHAEQLFGYRKSELIGKPIELLVPAKHKEHDERARNSFLESPVPHAMAATGDVYARKKSGDEFVVEVRLNPIVIFEETFIVSGILDISERKSHQIKLEKINNALEKKNNEMKQFIYTVSHDLKSPLVTIGGFTRRLKNELNGSINEKQLYRLDRITYNVTHMEQLLADLLQLSRIIQKDIGKELVDLDLALNTAKNSLEEEISETRSKISLHNPYESPYANKSMVIQIFQNLLSNSIRYRKENQDPIVDVRSYKEKSHVVVEISDNGVGIKREYHEKVFRIFERMGDKPGTGVGLSIVKTIMEKHKGRIELRSDIDCGSTFILYFPDQQSVT